ncbi:MAG: PaaI family thioesterase, partial [SAR324 cluster bacterium]|nr:PaaI family thioesterase [SAR324 cluster bacterium]
LAGVEFTKINEKEVVGKIQLRPELMAPNGYIHAGLVVTLADTVCAWGTRLHMSPEAKGLTTIELKTNFLSSAREGEIIATATPLHIGKKTQVWDAEVRSEHTGRVMAHFRNTQMILY